MKFLRYIAVVIVMFSSFGAMAQNSIEAAIATLQKSKSVTDEIFSERRDPSSRAVIRSSRMFTFDDDKMAARIQEAMKKERSKAVAFQMKPTSGQEVYSIAFEDNKHMYTKYVLIRKLRGGWVLSVDKSQGGPRDRSDCEIPESNLFGDDCVRPMICRRICPEELSISDGSARLTLIVTQSGSTDEYGL